MKSPTQPILSPRTTLRRAVKGMSWRSLYTTLVWAGALWAVCALLAAHLAPARTHDPLFRGVGTAAAHSLWPMTPGMAVAAKS
jgi:hypothetical protein